MLLTLQTRLKTLLSAVDYFDGVTIITEELADIDTALDQAIAELSFAIVIQVADGQHIQPASPALVMRERLVVTLIQNPLTDPNSASRNTVMGLEQAMIAIHNALVYSDGNPPTRFSVVSHASRRTEDGLAMQQCIVEAVAEGNTIR